MFLLSKKKYCLISVLVLILLLMGCSSDEDVGDNQKLVLQSVEVRNESTLEATFNDNQVKIINDFTLEPLEDGKYEVEFTYNGVKYQQQVNYNPSEWQWEKVTVTEAEGLSVLEINSKAGQANFDKLLVTSDLDYDPTKDGQGLTATSFDNHLYFEAEEASSQENFSLEVQESTQASQKKYVVVTEGANQEQLKYKFNLSGKVAVWLRVSKADALNISLKAETLTPDNDFEAIGQKYKLGLKPVKEEKYKSMPKMQILSNVTVPSQVDLSDNNLPVGNQGSQGSCVAWSTAYAYKTYQEKQDHNWKVNNRDHQFSPAYVYNQINGGQDRGSYISDAMNLIKNQGVCPLSVMPYDDGNYWTQPNSQQRQVASNYKAKSWGTIVAGNVRAMKNHLAAGDAISVALPVYPDFNVSSSNPVYDNTYGSLSGWHAITFVGYSDSKRAFKFINSWSSRWGFSGYGWMSYDLVNRLDTQGYTMTDEQTGDNDPEPDETYYKIVNKYSGKAVDVSGISTKSGANIYQWRYIGGGNQEWKIESVGNGYYKIINKHCGKALDVSWASKENGANIIQWDYHGGANQLWKIESVGNGYYKIINKNSGKALDVYRSSKDNGGNIIQWYYHGRANQLWKLVEVN